MLVTSAISVYQYGGGGAPTNLNLRPVDLLLYCLLHVMVDEDKGTTNGCLTSW